MQNKKRYKIAGITASVMAVLAIAGASLPAFAAPSYRFVDVSEDLTGGDRVVRIWYPDTTEPDVVYGINASTQEPRLFSIGSGLSAASNTLQVSNAPMSSISGLASALSSKQDNLPSQTAHNGKYLTTDGTSLSWANVPASGTVTSVNATSSDMSITGGPITSSGSLTFALNNTGVSAGSYSGVTVDAKGRVSAGTNRVFNNNVSRSFNSNYTISSTRDSRMSYSINASWTLNALLGGSGSAFLEYSTDGGSNWTTVNQVGKSLNLLTVAGNDDMNLVGEVPANALVRIRTTATNMTLSYVRGQEVLS